MNDNLFYIQKPNANAKLKLFCFPFAGGSSATYFPWMKWLDKDVELVCVQLPGRHHRIHDEPYYDMDLLVKDLTNEIVNLIDRPYMFFGYSLGAKVAYELALSLKNIGFPLPIQFIAAASPAPYLARRRLPIHQLPDDEFIQELVDYKGTPSELLHDKEMVSLFLPALRADFTLLETYRGRNEMLATKLTIYGGEEDEEVLVEELLAWRDLFLAPAQSVIFPGGHFFINNALSQLSLSLNDIFKNEVRLMSRAVS